MGWQDSPKKTFTAGEALAAHRRVKLKSGTTTQPPEVEYADAGEDFIGITEFSESSGELVTVRLKNAQGTFEVEASAAITFGANVYGSADGKISTTVSGSVQAIAFEASGAANDVIEVLLV